MAELNPNIILAAGNNVADPLKNFMAGRQTAMENERTNRTLALEEQKQQRAMEVETQKQQRAARLSDIYQAASGPDGSIDRKKLLTGLAQGGMAQDIPDAEKALIDNQDKKSQIGSRDIAAEKNRMEILYEGMKQVDSTLAAMIARPDVDAKMVMGELGRLVSAGAFDVQAAQAGTTPDKYAFDMASTMPVNNPTGLRQWLVQYGMKTADASKRLEMMLPKYDEQDRGGAINQGTIDPLTGQRTSGPSVAKSNTPGEMLSAATQQRGQNMADARSRQFNDIQKEAARTQAMTNGDGSIILVDKGTGTFRPAVSAESGAVAMDPAAKATQNAATYKRVESIIPMARDLLKSGPTASGVGAQADAAMRYIGQTTKGADAAQSLEALSGWLTSNVPRMEGPQSNADLVNYQNMAGKIGDRTIPVQTRLAALDVVEKIMSRYASTQAAQPTRPPVDSVVRRQQEPQPSARPSLDEFFMKK